MVLLILSYFSNTYDIVVLVEKNITQYVRENSYLHLK